LVDNISGGDTLKLNASKKVGAYTKKKGSEYSLFIAELAQPLDLTIYNTLKIQIKSPVTTSFLLKLEGASGNIFKLAFPKITSLQGCSTVPKELPLKKGKKFPLRNISPFPGIMSKFSFVIPEIVLPDKTIAFV
jgi:hypothetical protein